MTNRGPYVNLKEEEKGIAIKQRTSSAPTPVIFSTAKPHDVEELDHETLLRTRTNPLQPQPDPDGFIVGSFPGQHAARRKNRF